MLLINRFHTHNYYLREGTKNDISDWVTAAPFFAGLREILRLVLNSSEEIDSVSELASATDEERGMAHYVTCCVYMSACVGLSYFLSVPSVSKSYLNI